MGIQWEYFKKQSTYLFHAELITTKRFFPLSNALKVRIRRKFWFKKNAQSYYVCGLKHDILLLLPKYVNLIRYFVIENVND